MPTDEHSRTEYLRSLLNQQRNINANGGNLLNPAIPNTGGSLGAAAAMDTSLQGGGINSDVLAYDPERDLQQKNWFESAIDKIIGFTDEIQHQARAGFLGAFEGVFDLAATGLGALGDATGWYSSDPFTNWAKKDWATDTSNYLKTYMSFANLKNVADGSYFTEDYWRKNLQGLANAVTLGNAFGDEYSADETHGRYYKANDNLETGFGQFLGGAARSIGFMLPSIAMGNVAGAVSGSMNVAKAASLASMGLSAAGKGSEEALNEGASAGQALAYGAASGAVEVVSEIVVGKALGLVGLGTGKVMGVVGRGAASKTASVGSKTFIKELIKTMNEEGAEEIFSAVMEPLTKAIYKGGVDAENTYGNADWWFGTNGKFNESVLGQYASGAFVGGLSGGVQNAAVYKKVGAKGYQLVAESKNVAEAINDLQKADKGTAKYAKAEQRFGEAMSSFIKAENDFLESATKGQKTEIAKIFSNPNNMKAFTEALQATDVDASVTDYIKNYAENISTADKAVSYNFLSQMQRKYGSDVELRFDDSIDANGQYDAKANAITLNPKILSTKGGKVLAHEYFGHALSNNMSPGARAQFYQQIKSFDPSLVRRVENTYKELDKASPKMREEVISHFLERYFDDTDVSKQLQKVNRAFGDMTLRERIMQAFDKTAKQQKGKAIIKEYGRVLREFLQKSGDAGLIRAAAKAVLNQPLSKQEKRIADEYPSVFDVIKRTMTEKRAQGVFASRELVNPDGKIQGSRLREMIIRQCESLKDVVAFMNKQFGEGTAKMEKAYAKASGDYTLSTSLAYYTQGWYRGVDLSQSPKNGYEPIADVTFSKPEGKGEIHIYRVLGEFDSELGTFELSEVATNLAYLFDGEDAPAREGARDSEGNIVRPNVAEYFKNTKIVDGNGRLKVMYHGTPNPGFTVFDKGLSSGAFFFTDSELNAKTYAGLFTDNAPYSVYLNVTNPYRMDAKGRQWDKLDLGKKKKVGYVTWKTFKSLLQQGKIEPSYEIIEAMDSLADPFYSDTYSYFDDARRKTGKSFDELAKDFFSDEGYFKEAGLSSALESIENDELIEDSALIPIGGKTDIAEKVYEETDYSKTRDVVEEVLKMNENGAGYDGIIFDNLIDFGDSLTQMQEPRQVVVAFEPGQIKSIHNENPTENPDIFMSKDLQEDYDKHPERDPQGYTIGSDGQKIGLTNHIADAVSEMENDGINVGDYIVGETDYREGYVSKRFVNRANRNAEAIRSALEERFGEDFDDLEQWLQDHSEREYQDFLEFVRDNVSEDTIENVNNIVYEVDNCEYPNDEPPVYDEIESLADYLSSMREAADNWPDEYKKMQWQDALPGGDWKMAFFHERNSKETMSRKYEADDDIEQIRDDMAGNGMVLDAIYFASHKEVGTYSKYAHGQEDSYYQEIERMRDEGDFDEKPNREAPEEPESVQGAENKPEEKKYSYKVNVSPYRSSDVDAGTVSLSRKMLGRKFVHQAERIAKAIGIRFSYRQGVGGFVSEKGRYAGQQVNELTYEFTLNDVTMEQALDFAVLMKYLGHETQEGVIIKKYSSEGEEFNGVEFSVPIKGKYSDAVVQASRKSGLGNYTYLDSEGHFAIQASDDWGMSPEEAFERFQMLMVELRKEGLIDENRDVKLFKRIQSEYVGKEKNESGRMVEAVRGTAAEEWIQARLLQSRPSLRGLFEQAKRRIEVANRIDPLNEKIVRIQNANKHIDVSSFEHETKVDNGQTKTILKRTNASKPLFQVAKLSHRIANIEMEYIGDVLAKAAKSVGIDWDPVAKAQSFKKSIASTADRLYRNIKNNKGFDVYKLHDRLRTTFIFDMSNVDNMERLIRVLQPYIVANKGNLIDIANTDFGYKGVHLNLKIQDIEVEVQLHSEASWAIKLQQDYYYDKWRSKQPTNDAEKAEKERDRAASIALDEKLGRIHKIITETAKKLNLEYNAPETAPAPTSETAPTPTKSVPTPAPKAPVKQYYKSIETTRDIVTATGDLIVDLINNAGAYDYRIVYPDDFRDTSGVGMTKINGVKDTAKEAHRLMEVMAETYIEERNADGTYTTFGTVADILDPSVLTSLEPYVEEIIKAAPDTEARSSATRSLEMQINRALDKNRNLKNKVVRTRVLTNQRNAIKDMIDRYVEITDEIRAKEGLYTLLQPFSELHGSSSDAFQRRGFSANLKAALEWYTEENMNDPDKWVGIPFDPEVRQALVNVYESLGESERGSLSTETMRLSSKAINLIRQLIRKMRSDYTTRIRPSVDQSYAAIEASSYRKHTNLISKLYRMYKRGFAPAYVIIGQMLGDNSVLAKKLTFDMQKALNNAQLYRGGYGDLINKKLKELGLKRTFDRKRFEINGKSLTADQAMFLWNALNTKANFDAINDSGITFYDGNNNLAKVSEIGNAEALKNELERVLPANYREMAEFLLDTMNDSVKREYMKMYEDRYGKYEHRNEIGKVGDRSYWMLFRSYERITNTEKAVKNPAGMFSHALKRVNNENAVLVAGALSSFTAYTDQLSRELFVKPTYREALSILNTKGNAGQNIAMLLRQKVDEQDYHYLTNTLSDVLGANPFDKGNDVFSRAMSAFSVAKLSLNIGTMLKQFASIWTSNIPMTKSVKGVFSNIFKSSAVKAEYRALVDELGGLKYRESGKGVVIGNADSAGAFTQKIASVGMVGISKVDLFTVSSGVVSLMHIAEDQFKYKIGTDENKNWVKEHWTEFELSQIGGGALSKNAIQRGDFKQLPRLLFGFMQGANRAALGSQINKIGLLKRNYGADVKNLRQAKAEAKAARDAAKTAYEKDVNDKGLAKAYMEAEGRYLDAEAKLNDYERFKAAGGKAIPVHMACGLVAQGIFIALINELMKHVRGKKDKDDWEFVNDPVLWVLNTAKTIGLDWMPFVNAITSALLGSFERDKNGNIKVGKGYELSVPVVEMGNALVDIFNDAKEGNPNIWSIATLAGDMLGIPADLIKDYARGVIRLFDPATAEKMQSVLYGSSLQSANRSYQSFLDKGDSKSAKSMLKAMFAQFKAGNMSDSVADRIVRLEMNGYDVDAKSIMSAYTTADGMRVQLDAKGINAFRQAYSASDRAVRELMSTGEFQTSTQESQAALIKKIYDAYYAYAKAKVSGQADSKMASLLLGTNGMAVGRFIAMLSKISEIKATKTRSRKELVFDYLSGKGFSKAEKTLILHLAGYGLNDNAKRTLGAYLLAKGMSSKAVANYLEK